MVIEEARLAERKFPCRPVFAVGKEYNKRRFGEGCSPVD